MLVFLNTGFDFAVCNELVPDHSPVLNFAAVSLFVELGDSEIEHFKQSVFAGKGALFDDPFILQEYLSQFVEYIGGKAIVVPNAGHFNASAGYTKFEAILNELLRIE